MPMLSRYADARDNIRLIGQCFDDWCHFDGFRTRPEDRQNPQYFLVSLQYLAWLIAPSLGRQIHQGNSLGELNDGRKAGRVKLFGSMAYCRFGGQPDSLNQTR